MSKGALMAIVGGSVVAGWDLLTRPYANFLTGGYEGATAVGYNVFLLIGLAAISVGIFLRQRGRNAKIAEPTKET
jgi:hypothetical protein